MNIQIIGGPASGKSTLSKKMAERYDLRYIELDALYWKPNWERSSKEEFSARILQEMDAAKGGWVIDGSYTKLAGDVIQPRLDEMIYLQIPPVITLPRSVRRGMHRVFQRELMWGTNYETFSGQIKLGYWVLKTYRSRVKRIQVLKNSNPAFKVHIFKSNREANEWFEEQRDS